MTAQIDKLELVGGPLCGAEIEISLDPNGDGSFSQPFAKGLAFYKDRGDGKADFLEWKPGNEH